MTAREAYQTLNKKVSGLRVINCMEYDTVFVFQLSPFSLNSSKKDSRMLDSMMCVDKVTGKVRDFKPINIPIDEYRRGKQLPLTEFYGGSK